MGYSHRGTPMPSRRIFIRDYAYLANGYRSRDARNRVTRVGVEPTEHEGLSFAALPDCVPCHISVLDGI